MHFKVLLLGFLASSIMAAPVSPPAGLEARELTERTVERVGLEEKRDLDERWPPAPGGPGWKRDLDERWPPAPGGPGWKRDLDERWPPAPGGPGWKRDLDQH